MNRLGEGQSLELHDETEYVPSGTAPETVKDTLGWAHDERWGLFCMEGTKSFEVLPRLFKRYVFAYDPGYISPIFDLVDDLFRNRQFYSVGPRLC